MWQREKVWVAMPQRKVFTSRPAMADDGGSAVFVPMPSIGNMIDEKLKVVLKTQGELGWLWIYFWVVCDPAMTQPCGEEAAAWVHSGTRAVLTGF